MTGSSPFVGKTCSTLTGILNEYDPDLKTAKKIREHFVLDIDNKVFFFYLSRRNRRSKRNNVITLLYKKLYFRIRR